MESIRLLRLFIETVVKDVSVKNMIMKRSDGDENEDENETEKRVMVEKSITKNTSENLGNSAWNWFEYNI